MDALQFLIFTVSGWLTRRQQYSIEYLKEENRVLRQKLGGKRIRFTDKERRRLAIKATVLGRKALGESRLHRYTGYTAALVPAACCAKVRQQQTTRTGKAVRQRCYSRSDHQDSFGQSGLGVYSNKGGS